MDSKKLARRRCPECGSTLIHIRIKTGEIVCRSCGAVKKVVEVEGGK
jgi:uncharacterized Zn finger protein (UPF0148 family)